MGQQYSKPSLDTKWVYSVSDFDYDIQISFDNLKNKKLFKKEPDPQKNKQEYQDFKVQWEQFRKKVKCQNQQDQELLDNFPDKYKWRLLLKHNEIVNGQCQKNVLKPSPVKERLIKFRNNSSLPEITSLRRWMESLDNENEWKQFLDNKGIQIIFDVLTAEEMKSRDTKNYLSVIELLKLIQIILTFENGVEMISNINFAVQQIALCFNPIHSELICTCMEILTQFIWFSDDTHNLVLKGFAQFKMENKLKNRFQIFTNTLKVSRNIIVIEMIVQFINNLMTAPSNHQRINMLQQELEQNEIYEIYDLILTRLQKQQFFKIDYCTFENNQKELQNYKKGIFFEEKLQISELKKIELEGSYTDKQLNKKLVHSSSSYMDQDIKEESDESDSDDIDMSTMNEQEFIDMQQGKVYLELHEIDKFKKHVKNTKNGIQAFRLILSQSQGTDIIQLAKKLHQKALEEENLENLISLFQKLSYIPQNEIGQKIWENLNKMLSTMTGIEGDINSMETKELDQAVENLKDIDQIQTQLTEALELNKQKDQEIAELINDRNEVQKLKDLNQKNLEELKSQQAQEIEMISQNYLAEIEQLKKQIDSHSDKQKNQNDQKETQDEGLEKLKQQHQQEIQEYQSQLLKLQEQIKNAEKDKNEQNSDNNIENQDQNKEEVQKNIEKKLDEVQKNFQEQIQQLQKTIEDKNKEIEKLQKEITEQSFKSLPQLNQGNQIPQMQTNKQIPPPILGMGQNKNLEQQEQQQQKQNNGPPTLGKIGQQTQQNDNTGPPALGKIGQQPQVQVQNQGPPKLGQIGQTQSQQQQSGPPKLGEIGQPLQQQEPPKLGQIGQQQNLTGPPPLGGIGKQQNVGGPPPLGQIGQIQNQTNNGPPSLSGIGKQNDGPPKLSGIGSANNSGGPPPLGKQSAGGPPPLGGIGQSSGGPPPLGKIGQNSVQNNGPPPLGKIGQNNGPPPLGGIGQSSGGPPPLGKIGQNSVQNNGPPPLGKVGGPPPLGGIGQGAGGPPPLGKIGGPPPLGGIGQSSGGPPPLGKIGGPPPLGGLGNGGPPQLGSLGGPPKIGGLGGPPGLNLGGLGQPKPQGKPKCNPSKPLKNYMWQIVPGNQIEGTIWKDVDDTKIKVDKEYLESNFAKPQPKKPVSGAKEVAAKPPVPEKVSLLDQDRQKNVEIVLGKLRTSYSLLKNALIISDEKILTRSNLESLKNIIPNQMEADMIKGYLEDGDIEKLGNPEKFMAEIIQVKGYEARVKGHLFIKQYEEIFEELEPKVTQLKDGFDYLLKSKKLKDIFEHTLALGNYLNGTSARGGAYGFKLDSLEKSNDVRYEDNKRTLLMYIMDLIVEKHNGEDFITEKEQEYLTMISRLPVSQLRIDFSEINIGFRNIDKGIKTQTDDPNDTIKEKFEPYCGKIEERKNKLESEIKEAEELYAKCSKYFCENPTESSEKFGEKFMKFCKSVQSAKRIKKQVEDQIRRNKEKEEKEKKKMEDQKKLQSQSSQNTQNSQDSQKKLGGLAALKQNIQSSLKNKGDGDITNSLQTTFNSDFRKSKVPVVGFRQSYYNAKNPQDIINNLKENKQNKQGAAMPMPGFLAELQAKQKQK